MIAEVPIWAARLQAERRDRLWSQKEMARRLAEAADDHTRARLPSRESMVRMIEDWEAGRHRPRDPYPVLYSRVFGVDEAELFGGSIQETGAHDEIEALELARRAAASDVGGETLQRLEMAVDDLAVAW